ncbi:MAG TPA: hypothetical protein VFA48_10100 [Gammaproteobacteria bacterium]|nr:hypothetical protein [Gammaproteobacteria bacterium]
METVQRHLHSHPPWVIDRSGDRGRLWAAWLQAGRAVLVRATNRRYWQWRGRWLTAQQIARELPMRHRGQFRRGSAKSVRFALTQVHLREHSEHALTMIVVRHGKREPLVLVTTRQVRGRRQGERLIQAYLDRWACEEGYRFTKQGFALESVQARRFATLANLVALASLALALLAAHVDRGHALVGHAKPQKQKRPNFPFYTLLAGFQRLFAGARHTFHRWWRTRTPTSPPINDLFADQRTLLYQRL